MKEEASKRKLKKLDEMFSLSDDDKSITEIDIDKLVPFRRHPFKLYDGARFEDMVRSIRELGVLTPILVRDNKDSTYEILSGHNRCNAAKKVGLIKVPVRVLENVNDEEAMLIVTETNLLQRSFVDLLPSERAYVLSQHHEALKCQGKRTDIINAIKNLLEVDKQGICDTSDLLDQKLDSRNGIGNEYDLSSGTVARYLRVNQLNDSLKAFLDKSQIGLYVAVNISYLSMENQEYLAGFIDTGKKIDIKKSKKLRELQSDGKLNEVVMQKVLDGTFKPKKPKSVLKNFKVETKIMKKYFTENQSEEEVKNIIEQALAMYFKSSNS